VLVRVRELAGAATELLRYRIEIRWARLASTGPCRGGAGLAGRGAES
jgi:hypothetical protein